jgi:transglutaminase-like putative cysteine protease
MTGLDRTDSRPHLAATLLFAGSLVLLVRDAPPWCIALAFACVGWRLAIGAGVLRLPPATPLVRYVFAAITALCVLAVLMSFQTLNGLAAGTALLVLMGALKLAESRSRRDDGIVVAVALFMLLAAALADQSLWRLPLYLLFAWGACAAMALIAHPGGALSTRAALRLSARALAMAIPLAAACFLFFPRVSGQFWSLQRGAEASTGLGDEMSPGSIGKLATEYDPAFRVRFEGAPPPREALYFRGPVLNSFDGFTWRRERSVLYRASKPEMLGQPVRYRVTLEPTHRPYIFTLDSVAGPPARGMYFSHDRQLTASDNVTSVRSYDAVSHLDTRDLSTLSTLGRRHETRLIGDRNPRARALAIEMRSRASGDAEFARAVLQWFQAQGLEYTLEPGTTSLDSVDTTLFETKLGFCAHFASAYATMMRAAGVPARVVTGYLGGEWNPVGGYLLVRQSEAHAWTEIWLDGRGWTRVDPTAVVSPERLQRGVYDMLADSLPASSALYRTAWVNRLSQLWDGANQWWQDRVVEFNLRSQLDVLRKLGIDSPDWRHLGWAFAAGLMAWLLWIAVALRRSVARARPDRIGRAWLAATAKLSRVAPPRAANEGPIDYATRIASARPDLAPAVTEIARRYCELRFGRTAANDDVEALERAVRKLKSGSGAVSRN